MNLSSRWPEALLSRVEDAGLNASAPPQQRWIDGWLVRCGPGKARRARCVQPVADGRLPLDERLSLCEAWFAECGLPALFRITPFSQPAGLDAVLAARGWHREDDTRVMVATPCPNPAEPLPPGVRLEHVPSDAYAAIVGALRGSSDAERAGHAQRLALSPVPYQGWVLRRSDDGVVLCCGQTAAEGDMVGLYDVFTAPEARGQGLARLLCGALLARAQATGARVAYLQVDAANAPARAVYQRLGFADAYGYHYRSRP